MFSLNEFLAEHRDIGRGVDADVNLVAFDLDYRGEDVVGNADGFADAADQNRHGALLPLEVPK